MNWINKVRSIGEKIKKNIKKKFPSQSERDSSNWTSCCRGPILKETLKENFYQCPDCLKTFPVLPKFRFESLFLKNSYEIINAPMVRNEDPLQWTDASGKYIDKLKSTKNNTNTNSSVQAAEGKLTKDINAVVVCSDFKFFGASTSMNEGEQILYACDRSLKSNSPLIIFAQGGGMRMQSGMLSLYQMPRTIIGISEVRKKNIPVIIIVDVVASGGISASYAAVGDFLIFEGEKSKFMFAGPRVIQGTISEGELPISFQEGTFCVSHGFGDFIIKNRKDTKNTLVKLLNILLKIDTSVNSVSSDETSEDNRTLTKAAS